MVFPWFSHPNFRPIDGQKSPQAPQVLALDSAPVEVAGASQA
jgi:hypothetical protein